MARQLADGRLRKWVYIITAVTLPLKNNYIPLRILSKIITSRPDLIFFSPSFRLSNYTLYFFFKNNSMASLSLSIFYNEILAPTCCQDDYAATSLVG